MNIIAVDQVLAEHHDPAEHMRVQPLAALEPRRDPYFALLCQPHGTIHASATRIGNSVPADVRPMYRSFLDRAVSTSAQLVVAPEYSVPWEVLNDVIAGQVRPPKGSIWALGFESITPEQLETMRTQVAAQMGVRLIYEPFDPTQRAQKVFVDPLVYLFWTWNASDQDVLCILVQFKTVTSRDPDHVELTSLYVGSRVYKFDGRTINISLIGIICSDAFELTNELVDQHHSNLLLLHIQLNQRPCHGDYAAYRSRLFSIGSNSNVEVLCLNWAAHSALEEGNGASWNAIAGSAWYVAPHSVDLDDREVDQLHQAGVYYSLVGERWHGFYLNFGPHALLLRKQRVFAAGPQALVQRILPQVVERTTWEAPKGQWMNASANDGFGAFIQAYTPLEELLPALCSESPLAVERALELLEGPTGNAVKWFSVKELRALKVGHEESLRWITVSQEFDSARAGVEFRRGRVRRAQTAVTIPTLTPRWPPAVADLAAGFKYRWNPSDPHCNVEPIAGNGVPATFVYLGEDPEADTIANVYAKLLKAIRTHAATKGLSGHEPDSALSQRADRLCIAYKRNHTLEFYRSPHQTLITDPRSAAPNDIIGESP